MWETKFTTTFGLHCSLFCSKATTESAARLQFAELQDLQVGLKPGALRGRGHHLLVGAAGRLGAAPFVAEGAKGAEGSPRHPRPRLKLLREWRKNIEIWRRRLSARHGHCLHRIDVTARCLAEFLLPGGPHLADLGVRLVAGGGAGEAALQSPHQTEAAAEQQQGDGRPASQQLTL